MKAEDLIYAIGEVSDSAVADAAKAKRRFPAWAKALATAACLCLVFTGAIALFIGGMGAGAGGSGGSFAGDWYYYRVNGKGVYRHSLEAGSEKVLARRHDYWDMNDYGVYYRAGRRLYVIEHDSGDKRLLYRSGLFESTHIGFTLKSDGDVIVTVYDKHDEYCYEVLVDGVTGEVLETVMEKTSYDNYWNKYSDTHFLVGEREIVLEPVENGAHDFYMTEDGEYLTDEEVSQYPNWCGEALWFEINDDDGDYYERCYYVVRPDGEDSIVEVPYPDAGFGDFIFYSENTAGYGDVDKWTLYCVDITSGESWEMETDNSEVPLYELETNGELLYSSAPWTREVACWEVVCDDGLPVGLRLLDENINE